MRVPLGLSAPALLLLGCLQPDPAARRAPLASPDAAATPELGSSCGVVSYQGCCQGANLQFCAAGQLLLQSCGQAQCGWDALFGVYACGSSTGADPTGNHPRACPSTDAGSPAGREAGPVDLGPRPGSDRAGCGSTGFAGCCSGTTLHFCVAGQLLSLDCSKSPGSCGWNAGQGYYSCGTSGQAEPTGVYPRVCLGVFADGGATDAQLDLPGDGRPADAAGDTGGLGEPGSDGPRPARDGLAAADRAAEPAGGDPSGLDPSGLEISRSDAGLPHPEEGCGCQVGAGGSGSAGLALLLVAGWLLRRRSARLLLGAALLLPGCQQPGPQLSRQQRALAGDAAGEGADLRLDAGCPIPFHGCCDGETLWWCEQGRLKSLHCGARPYCGFSNNGIYDCNTSGAQDPTGMLGKDCELLGVTVPPSDGGVAEAGGACQGITREGCCKGQVLFYCEEGQLKSLACGLNPLCGWQANGQLYDCGTNGLPDPSGRYLQSCPAGLPDSAAPAPLDLRLEGTRAEPTPAADQAPPGDCSCGLGRRPGGAGLLLLLLAALLAAGRRGRPQIR